MFKQVKSILFWTLIYKFRKRLTLIAILISIVFFSQWMYTDLVEYLKITEKTEYLTYLLPGKWIIIFFSIGCSTYLLFTIIKPERQYKKNPQTTTSDFIDENKTTLINKLKEKQQFISKNKIKGH